MLYSKYQASLPNNHYLRKYPPEHVKNYMAQSTGPELNNDWATILHQAGLSN